MRGSLFKAEQELFLCEAQKFYLEEENSELKAYIAENRPNYVPEYVEDFEEDPEAPELNQLGI